MVSVAVHCSADETCYDGNDAILQQWPHPLFTAIVRKIHERLGASEAIVSYQYFRGFDGFAGNAVLGESGGEKRRGETFAEAGNCVAGS